MMADVVRLLIDNPCTGAFLMIVAGVSLSLVISAIRGD